MKINLTSELAHKMIIGSSIYSTGGGYERSVQEKQFKKLFKTKKSFPLISIDELADDDYICTAYAVGSAANTNYDLSAAFKIGLQTMERQLGKRMKGIYAGETNIDVLAFQTAAHMQLPVIDADCTGGRAVPEIQFDNFALFQKSVLPLIAISPSGDVVLLTESKSLESVELFVRNLAVTAKKGLIAVLSNPIQVKDAKKILTLNIFQRSLALGEYLQTHKHISYDIRNEIEELISGKQLIAGKVTDISLSDTDGFLTGYYFVTGENGSKAKIFVKNENMICWINNKVILTPPDSILSFDPIKKEGIHNSTLYKGREIILFGKKAPKMWRSKKGQEIFHPKKLGFMISSHLLS